MFVIKSINGGQWWHGLSMIQKTKQPLLDQVINKEQARHFFQSIKSRIIKEKQNGVHFILR